jgi:ankyrin repeat protein
VLTSVLQPVCTSNSGRDVVQDGSTALHLAAWKNKIEVVRVLASAGADYRAAKSDGQTALHEAAEAGSMEAVEHLLSVGANAQARICWHQPLRAPAVPAQCARQQQHSASDCATSIHT